MPVSKFVVRSLTHFQRSLLMAHLDGCKVPITKNGQARGVAATRSLRRLIDLKFISPIPPASARPAYTVATLAGREAIAVILGDCADALVAAGFLERSRDAESPLEALRRLKMAKIAENGPDDPGNAMKPHHFPLDL